MATKILKPAVQSVVCRNTKATLLAWVTVMLVIPLSAGIYSRCSRV